MSKTEFLRPNALGDLRAEADQKMLSQAFLETGDYRTLIETSDKTVVVGRRGTGKSALTIYLENLWGRSSNTVVVKIAPEEHQTIGLRPQVALFGDTFTKIRAGARLAWRYALMMEVARSLAPKYRFSSTEEYSFLSGRMSDWESCGRDVLDRYSETLRKVINQDLTPEGRIADLSKSLDLARVEEALAKACKSSNITVAFLIDKLDEGYEPDDSGVGLVDGLVQAAIDLKTRIPEVKPVIFLRDNIFRAVQVFDPDYSRNIEGHVLRLHWDADALFTFATARMRIAFDVKHEASLKIWNNCTGRDLKGREGFNRCLQLTLYRPRDLLSLLNETFYLAGKNNQAEIVTEHIENTGRTISRNRLDDLRKEYQSILPGLDSYTSAFHGCDPNMTVDDARKLLETVLRKGSDNPHVQQDFFILEDSNAVIRGLYSIGFLGIRDGSAGTFIYCHDGRAPDREFTSPDRVLVHPCYWMALNCTRNTLDPDEAEEIHDEYDIEVSSETPEIRNSKIRELISALEVIEEGESGAAEYETWCKKAIRICFAKGLRNVELKSNALAKSRQDVIATNLGEGDVWRRIYDDYGTKQVIFEIQNKKELQIENYQNIQSYLTSEHGRLAFIVTRDDSVDLYANNDVDWMRDIYTKHDILIVKLTGKYLSNLLHKLRKPQKHDDVNNAIHRLIDTYTHLYILGKSKPTKKEKRIRKRRQKSLVTE